MRWPSGWPLGRSQRSTAARSSARWKQRSLWRRHNLPIGIEEGVGESRYGDWTGQPLKELAKAPEWMQVQFMPSLARFPTGEGMGEMQARAVAARALRTAIRRA